MKNIYMPCKGSARHDKAVSIVKDILLTSDISGLKKVYLYGSHARGEARYGSDIDILLVLSNDVENMRPVIRSIKDAYYNSDYDNVEIDIHCAYESSWNECNDTFIKNIHREGVLIYES